jgi:hypothetical protein
MARRAIALLTKEANRWAPPVSAENTGLLVEAKRSAGRRVQRPRRHQLEDAHEDVVTEAADQVAEAGGSNESYVRAKRHFVLLRERRIENKEMTRAFSMPYMYSIYILADP